MMKRVLHQIPAAVWLLLPGVATAFVPSRQLLPAGQRISTTVSSWGRLDCPRIPALQPLYLSTTSSAASDASIQRNATSSTSSWDEDDGYSDDWSNDGDEIDDENSPQDSMEDSLADDDYNDDLPLTSKQVQEYEAWSTALRQALKKLRKKHQSLESELVKAQNVEGTVLRAQLLVSNLYLFPRGTKSAWITDWENGGVEMEITLDPQYESASAEADALFAQARKLKRGSQVVQSLLEETSAAMATLEDNKLDLESARISETEIDEGRLALVKERLIRSARTTNFQIPDPSSDSDNEQANKSKRRSGNSKPELGTPASNIRKLTSPGGCTVLVGRNRRGNEYLSLTLARQDDIWMHSRGCPGAHVVIQNRRGGPTPTEACLQFAADLAIFYSDLRTEAKAEVTAAEPKHLLKPRGAPLGAIKIREEWKTFVGRPDQVPEELKDARDKSGQSDEYRQEDKAKHRRRTRQAAEEEKAKRRKKSKN